MKSGEISFKPRARLLKIIGEELIGDEVVAMMELVKNAYDADASRVTIDFNCSDENESSIEIRDDGHGMNLETLLDGWMHPAGSSKRGKGPRRTRTGRRLLGEKGVGRFASDKLGNKLEITSRAPRNREISATFEWDQFEDDEAMLSDVTSRWVEHPRYRVFKEHGTILRITGLRVRWTERMYRKVVLKLARLRSPSSDHGGFDIEIRSDLFPDYSDEINRDFLSASPYSIHASYDGDGMISYRLMGQKMERLPWSGGGAFPRCGPVQIRLHAFDLETESVSKVGPVAEARAWLRQWSGISVFRDGYRVYPYGEPNDDWLRLDQRRVNNPVVRLSNNQVVGFVEIERDTNPELLDKTNREGLQANVAFEDLRRFVHSVLQIIETERQVHRGNRRSSSLGGFSENTGEDPLEALDKIVSGEEKLTRSSLREVLTTLREQRRTYASERKALADLSGTGLVTRSMLNNFSETFVEMRRNLDRVKSFLSGNGSRAASSATRAMDRSIRQIESTLDGSGLLEASGKRGSVNLLVEVKRCRDKVLAEKLLDKKLAIHIKLQGGDLPRVYLPVLTIRRALYAIIENAIESSKRGGTIEVILKTDGNKVLIRVRDHGKGISQRDRERVFDPGFSRKGGDGMGLTVTRAILEPAGGQIRIGTRKQQKRGTTVEILLPRKLSRATRIE